MPPKRPPPLAPPSNLKAPPPPPAKSTAEPIESIESQIRSSRIACFASRNKCREDQVSNDTDLSYNDDMRRVSSFLAIGDWGTFNDRLKATAKQMARYAKHEPNGIDLVLALGDNFYPSGVNKSLTDFQKWQEVFIDPYPSLHVPWKAVLGNHDYKQNASGQLRFTVNEKNPKGLWQTRGDAILMKEHDDANPFPKEKAPRSCIYSFALPSGSAPACADFEFDLLSKTGFPKGSGASSSTTSPAAVSSSGAPPPKRKCAFTAALERAESEEEEEKEQGGTQNCTSSDDEEGYAEGFVPPLSPDELEQQASELLIDDDCEHQQQQQHRHHNAHALFIAFDTNYCEFSVTRQHPTLLTHFPSTLGWLREQLVAHRNPGLDVNRMVPPLQEYTAKMHAVNDLLPLSQARQNQDLTWRIFFAHQPFYSAGKGHSTDSAVLRGEFGGMRQYGILRELQREGVDLVCSGHDHVFAYKEDFTGMMHAVTGNAAGSTLYGGASEVSATSSDWHQKGACGFMWITIDASEKAKESVLTLRFIDASSGGKVLRTVRKVKRC